MIRTGGTVSHELVVRLYYLDYLDSYDLSLKMTTFAAGADTVSRSF